jgi:hypothetical protein
MNASSPGTRGQQTRRGRSVALPSGLSLSAEEVQQNKPARRARVIVLAGSVGSGKTTLVAAAYDAFGSGPAMGYQFAGSDTLMALEQRCHESRIGSGLEVATTARTPRGPSSDFAHIALARDGGVRSHVYLSDVSGEIFRDVVTVPTLAADIGALALADRVQLLLDGAAMLKPGLRDIATYDLAILARAISRYGGLKAEAKFDVVLSKLDLIAGDALTFANDALDQVRTAIPAERVGYVLKVCARTADRHRARSLQGMEELLAAWTGAQIATPPDPVGGMA